MAAVIEADLALVLAYKGNGLRLPHTSRFFVVELQIFCRGQIGVQFVGTSACRTLADFLSRLTAFSKFSAPTIAFLAF